ncbi:phage terminase small subunit [Ferrimonas senticii]|uniref:phage terminase small subunit n=1 Tax=Ferrimonas senticii TaxID=394566 RepID=UPI000421CE33|nr:phage terminase small subunit [Ferrimonas senticii]
MISPAANFREQVTFKAAPNQWAAERDTIERQFDEDLAFLRQLARQDDRNDFKRDTLLPRYLPEVARYLAAGKVYQHRIFVQCIVWLFDTEQLGQALDYTHIAVMQGQTSPFRRPMEVFAADVVFAWAERQFAARQSIDPYFAVVLTRLTHDWRLPEPLCARYYKLAALHILAKEDPSMVPSAIDNASALQTAQKLLEMAQQQYSKIGVKTLIGRISMRLNAL